MRCKLVYEIFSGQDPTKGEEIRGNPINSLHVLLYHSVMQRKGTIKCCGSIS